MRILPVVATAMVVGCASSASESMDSPAAAASELTVSIEPHSNGWFVHTSRAASIAVFEIVPNRGVGLVYPDPSREDGQVSAGSTRITETGAVIRRHRAAYLSPVGTGSLDAAQISSARNSTGAREVVVIACECSLDLEQLSTTRGPAEVVGSFASVDAPSAGARLIRAVLPPGTATYAVDRYAVRRR